MSNLFKFPNLESSANLKRLLKNLKLSGNLIDRNREKFKDMFTYIYPATAVAVADPTNNLEAQKVGLLCMLQQRSSFSHVTLGCSDFVSSIPTEVIANPVSKFLLEKKLRSLKHDHFRL